MTCRGNVSEICRICLKHSDNVTNIFRTKINSVLIAEVVSICSSSYIWEESGMPGSVCPKCLQKLECYWELRNCIKSSENILRSKLETEDLSTVDKFALNSLHQGVSENDTQNFNNKQIEDITIKVEPDSFQDVLLGQIPNEVKTEEIHTEIPNDMMCNYVICDNKVTNVGQKEDIDAHRLLSDVLELDMLKDDTSLIKNDDSKYKSKHKRPKINEPSRKHSSKEIIIGRVRCKSCNKSFSPEGLKLHDETVHKGSKMFKCQICNSYISLKYYDMHMAVHT